MDPFSPYEKYSDCFRFKSLKYMVLAVEVVNASASVLERTTCCGRAAAADDEEGADVEPLENEERPHAMAVSKRAGSSL